MASGNPPQRQPFAGHRAVIFFLVSRDDVRTFAPADDVDPEYGSTLRRVVAVASNTLREARRNRVFLGICAAAVVLQFVALALSDLALVEL